MEPLRVRPLTDTERDELMRWMRDAEMSETLRRRARVILLSSYGISSYVIGLLIPMGRKNVAPWIRRFNTEGLAGLRDRPRPGRPPHAKGDPPEGQHERDEPTGDSNGRSRFT